MLAAQEASTATHIHANKINYKVTKVPINNRITKVAGPHINNIAQCVNDFRIVVSNNYHIYYVVPAIFLPFCTDGYYLFVWGILVFLGVGDFPPFSTSKRIAIVMMHSATVLCGLCVLHRNGL